MVKTEVKINRGNERLICFLAFSLPVVMFLLLCAVNHKLPFGEATYLSGDMVNQYIKYFSYLKSIAAGENDAFYTFTKALGGDMTGLWAYYLMSPLNIFLIFAPVESFPLVITFIIAAKLGLCGLTMAIMLCKLHKPSFGMLMFSNAYALMSYNISYYNNIMWLDGVYLLPIIILGLEYIVREKNAVVYVISLACALIFNYYIAYMICIFVVLFFLYRMVQNLGVKGKSFWPQTFKFIAGSLLAGALAAVILVPTAISLSGTKASFDIAKLTMQPLYTLSQHLSKLVCSAVPTGFVEGDSVMRYLPHIYCGAIITFLAVTFFFNSKIKSFERAAAATFVLILYLISNHNGTYLIWHAFNPPALFPYRYAFMISFIMLWFAWRSYTHIDGVKTKGLVLAAIVVCVAVLVIDPNDNRMVSKKMLLLDITAMTTCGILIWQNSKWLSRRICTLVLAVAQCFLLLINANSHAVGTLNSKTYAERYDQLSKSVDTIEQYDAGFYRLARPNSESNLSMLHNYNGLDHFSSTEQTSSKNFVINFGYRHFMDVWVHYTDCAPASGDAFLGFKYLLGTPLEYKNYTAVNNGEFYLNPNALEIAFPASKDILSAQPGEENIFLWQNQLFSSVLGHEAGIFKVQQDVELEVLNMSEKPFKTDSIEYNRIEADKKHALVYRFTVTDEAPLFIYTDMPHVEAEVAAELSVNGKDMGSYLGSSDWRAVYLGTFEPGDKLEVMIKPQATFFLQNDTYFAYENQQALAQVCAQINTRSENAQIEKIKNSYLRWTGTVTEESPVLLFTVPHDKGWRAEVDGEPAEILTVLDTLIALELAPGEHVVELRFTTPGLYAGLTISACALVVFIVLMIKKKI